MSKMSVYYHSEDRVLPNIDELTHSFEFSKRTNLVKLWINSLNSNSIFIDLIILDKNNNYQRTIDTISEENQLTMNYLIENNIIDIINIDNCESYKIYNFQLSKSALLQLI